jgi:acetyltransferase-like isoleucine patch superfamily enzyme
LTSPIVVGDNCWIGERSSIMKGTQIGDNVIVGYNTMLLNKIIESNKRVVQDINLRIL